MTSQDNFAYVVPRIYWHKIMAERPKEKDKDKDKDKGQSGGGIAGLDGKGGVDANQLLSAMAVNMSLSRNPHASFVQHTDTMLKQTMNNPKLSDYEKVHFMQLHSRAYDDQRKRALAAPVPAAPQIGQKRRPAPPPPTSSKLPKLGTPGPSGTASTPKTPKQSLKYKPRYSDARDKIQEIMLSPEYSAATKSKLTQTLATSVGMHQTVLHDLRTRTVTPAPSKKGKKAVTQK